MRKLEELFFIAILILLSYFSFSHLFISGFFPIHDDTQVARVFGMGKALSDGVFPVRWIEDLGYGYGYPIFNFYAPLSYYFGGFLNILGFDALTSTKIMIFAGIVISGISMFMLTREFWGNWGGLFSALLFVYAPYHALDIYVRGDIAESWAYGFIPLVFWGALKAYKEKRWIFVFLGSLAFAGVITSHNLTAFILAPFMVVLISFLYLANKKRTNLFYSLFVLFFGLGISSFYVFPAIFEMKYTDVLSQIGGGADFRDHFVCLFQLWDSPWGFGGSTSSCIDGMSFKIGRINLLFALLSILVFFGYRFLNKKVKFIRGKFLKNEKSIFFSFSILGFLISIFFTLSISKIFWEIIPFMEFLQYPWRFLILISFFSSFLAGFSVWFIGNLFRNNKIFYYLLSAVIILFIIYFQGKLFVPQTILEYDSSYYTNEEALKWRTSKISDEFLPQSFEVPKKINEIGLKKVESGSKGEVLYQLSKTGEIHASLRSSDTSEFKINIPFFPAWEVYLDNKKVPFNIGKRGVGLDVPKGEHALDVYFVQTPLEKFSNALSLVFLFALLAGIIFPISKSNEKNK
ncbi:hypothetical protein A3F29_00290 [Candidatus Roizmanbacteria bacterium RIFCSPHIGHO2_12_FULL_33_9]|uniref:Membrane protein 6-pyruvoyl-tetrahydropterin synthase-related domain-containing protein n=1 Tax=Candidatus Roizmanbacteria bacterium RIFCSPHIGHO2_12_FULL_33_9 TaxID=1802045 RepID=A0A1F7HGR4_9BACT|nr:MAG: hypothetical protein A3F29_00290 [Candidatus Roizmanbacteria bacterium RIFCSPHIGHO2_12_FULL_33_9]